MKSISQNERHCPKEKSAYPSTDGVSADKHKPLSRETQAFEPANTSDSPHYRCSCCGRLLPAGAFYTGTGGKPAAYVCRYCRISYQQQRRSRTRRQEEEEKEAWQQGRVRKHPREVIAETESPSRRLELILEALEEVRRYAERARRKRAEQEFLHNR